MDGEINEQNCSILPESSETKPIDFKHHWNKAYDKTEIKKLGWYEENPEPSINLIEKCELTKDSVLLNVGVGASTLIDELLKLGFENIIANDISESALNKLKARLGSDSVGVKWIVDDLSNPTILNTIDSIDLWHDRAVLHFLNKKEEQQAYFNLIKQIVKSKAYVIIAAFNLNGATKCCGLPVYRYDEKMLTDRMGDDFELIENFDYTYLNPFGDTREYIYTLFRRK